jgi:hypothetical protein
MYRRLCWPERREFEHNYDQEFPRRSKCSAKGRVVEKLCICSGDPKGRSTGNLERNPIKRPSQYKGHIPVKLEGTFANLCTLRRKEVNLPEEKRHR